MKWICVFDNVRIRARWIGPLRLTECSPRILWADVALLTIRSECLHGMFATCSFSVCYIFAMQKGGFCATKVWFLACKNPLFTLQKPPFYIAKTPFLKCNILNKEHGTTKCGIIYKVYCHRILMLNLAETRCSGILVWCAFWFLDMANTLQNGV